MGKAEQRQQAILEIAAGLFQEKGYDGTSMADIQTAAGIARGTLYHHFPSKEAILDALIQHYADQLFARAEAAAADKRQPALARFLQVISSLNLNQASGLDLTTPLHQPQNALLHEKFNQLLLDQMTPLLAAIVTEGAAEGVFDTPYPYQATEMAMLASLHQPLDSPEALEAFIYHLEKLFGVQKGGFDHVYQLIRKGGD